VLGAGNYTLTASGNNSAAVGTYAGSIAISDSGPTSPNTVPEPGSSALLLAGLGAALATRRKSRADNSGQCRNHLDPKAASSAASFAAPAKNG
jgi:hypothetical protein